MALLAIYCIINETKRNDSKLSIHELGNMNLNKFRHSKHLISARPCATWHDIC